VEPQRSTCLCAKRGKQKEKRKNWRERTNLKETLHANSQVLKHFVFGKSELPISEKGKRASKCLGKKQKGREACTKNPRQEKRVTGDEEKEKSTHEEIGAKTFNDRKT